MRILSILMVLAATLAEVGCGAAPGVAIQSVGESPAGSVSPGLISVPIGIVLAFQATTDGSTPVTASIDDPAVALFAPTTQTSKFVVVGLSQGQTTLHVFVGGTQATQIAVQVTPSVLQVEASDASAPSAAESGSPAPSASP